MSKHQELHVRGVPVLQCSMCSYSTTRSNHLTRHQLRQHSSTAISCSVAGCMYVARNDRQFQRHIKSRHRSDLIKTSPSFPCTVPGCGYTAATQGRLVRHKARHRAVEGDMSSVDLVHRYRCSKCSYETNQREHFRRHMDCVHNDVRPFLCDVCGRRFKRHDALLQHGLLVHTYSQSVASHQCRVCQRTFRSKVSPLCHSLTRCYWRLPSE